jgi:hypothetical protein
MVVIKVLSVLKEDKDLKEMQTQDQWEIQDQ